MIAKKPAVRPPPAPFFRCAKMSANWRNGQRLRLTFAAATERGVKTTSLGTGGYSDGPKCRCFLSASRSKPDRRESPGSRPVADHHCNRSRLGAAPRSRPPCHWRIGQSISQGLRVVAVHGDMAADQGHGLAIALAHPLLVFCEIRRTQRIEIDAGTTPKVMNTPSRLSP